MKKLMLTVAFLGAFSLHSRPLVQKFRIGIAPYGTHFPALATVVANTSGPILELGCGDYSTPMLHGLCAPSQRKLVSTDTSRSWLTLFADLERDWHKFIYVPAFKDDYEYAAIQNIQVWDTVGNGEHWGVVLVDHLPPARRKVDIQRLRANTDVFVVHDTENPAYEFDSILPTFKYKYVYERYDRTTTIVSDVIDVTQFFEM